MKFINIGKLYEIDDFILAKMEIEKHLLETGKIEKKMPLQDYIKFLDIAKTIYVSEKGITPFSIIEINDTIYIHYTTENDDLDFEEFEKIVYKYKENKLEKIDMFQLYLSQQIQPEYPYVIIDNVLYK